MNTKARSARYSLAAGLLASLVALGMPGTAGADEPAPDVPSLRAGAWDHSVTLELRGDLKGAREVLMRAWGPESDSYEVTVRLAWLSMKLGHTEEAIALYRRARTIPPSEPDSAQGLSAVLTRHGYGRLDEGDRRTARSDFQEALSANPNERDAHQGLRVLGPESRVDPEVWVAYLNHSVLPDRFQGWAAFVHVPWWATDEVRLRLAARHVETYTKQPPSSTSSTASPATSPLEQPPPPPPAGAGSGQGRGAGASFTTDRQEELYASAGWSGRYVGVEAMGFGVYRSDEGLIPGEALSLRLGGRYGVRVEQVALHRDFGWGVQLIPTAYWWPARTVGLYGGVRYTHDPRGTEGSVLAGLELVGETAGLHLQGHVGNERWPFSMSTPSVLAVESTLPAGATATTTFRVAQDWRLGLQGQWERIEVPAFTGNYFSVSTGVIWSPTW